MLYSCIENIPAGCFSNWRWKNQKFCECWSFALETFITRRFSIICKLTFPTDRQNSIQTNLFLVLPSEFATSWIDEKILFVWCNRLRVSALTFSLAFTYISFLLLPLNRCRYWNSFRCSTSVLCQKSFIETATVLLRNPWFRSVWSHGTFLSHDGISYAFCYVILSQEEYYFKRMSCQFKKNSFKKTKRKSTI